jgi:hypothetical protein
LGSAKGRERYERLEQLKGYLKDNANSLVDQRLRLPLTGKERRKLPTLGTVEGNINKILACRFKRRGMSWSQEGAHRLAKILALRSNGELAAWMRQKKRLSTPLSPEVRQSDWRMKRMKKHFSAEEAKVMGETLGINWIRFDVEQLRMGMDVELEHGTMDATPTSPATTRLRPVRSL